MCPSDLLDAACMRRDTGMTRASRAVAPGWASSALAAVHAYARTHETFMAEDVRMAAGTPDGVNGRAWGPIFKQAQRAGIIRADGYAPASSSNLSPKVRWRSLVVRMGEQR